MLKRGALVLLASSVLVTGACSDDDNASSEDTTSTSAPAACEADDGDATELETLIVDEAPDGFEMSPDDVGDTGPSDLTKAARDDGLDDAEQALTDLRFRRGYQRLWSNEVRDELIVFLYEFCDAEGAEGYADRAVDEFFGIEPNLEPFEVSGAPGARGYRGEQDGQGFVAILTRSGDFALQVVSYGASVSVSLEELTTRAESVASAQVAAID